MANSNTDTDTNPDSTCWGITKRVGCEAINKPVGWFVWLFGDKSISEAQKRLLKSTDDAEAEAFRKALLNDNRLLATSGSIMIAASVALLSHTSASQTHPATHCFLLFGIVSSILGVQHALEESRVLSLLVKPSDLKDWVRKGTLRGDRNDTKTWNNSLTTQSHGQGLSGQQISQQSPGHAEAGGAQGSEGQEERGGLAASIPGAFSSFAFHSVVVGCLVHLGTVRSADDKTSPPMQKRPQFLAFIIALGIGYLLHKLYSVGLPKPRNEPSNEQPGAGVQQSLQQQTTVNQSSSHQAHNAHGGGGDVEPPASNQSQRAEVQSVQPSDSRAER
ncbi:hypothetical protein BO86DRAFT_400865 [Aspergillus japonicus CBS 114.51]|uniref:Uncharacterized protein n=1 Tax=Aspergillus japonicus CBS 114.51 TaxID=1448312 RepID=A0A8T8WWU5_ASPJA|nr:hypothetical protein BO86DRAFT_400865 [Aspergillus japonicus CBS 114.51]RAH80318.1 hypothetical protein BO86DRAFT_400865 [Aspergillus japonicus CBS 114.51]